MARGVDDARFTDQVVLFSAKVSLDPVDQSQTRQHLEANDYYVRHFAAGTPIVDIFVRTKEILHARELKKIGTAVRKQHRRSTRTPRSGASTSPAGRGSRSRKRARLRSRSVSPLSDSEDEAKEVPVREESPPSRQPRSHSSSEVSRNHRSSTNSEEQKPGSRKSPSSAKATHSPAARPSSSTSSALAPTPTPTPSHRSSRSSSESSWTPESEAGQAHHRQQQQRGAMLRRSTRLSLRTGVVSSESRSPSPCSPSILTPHAHTSPRSRLRRNTVANSRQRSRSLSRSPNRPSSSRSLPPPSAPFRGRSNCEIARNLAAHAAKRASRQQEKVQVSVASGNRTMASSSSDVASSSSSSSSQVLSSASPSVSSSSSSASRPQERFRSARYD